MHKQKNGPMSKTEPFHFSFLRGANRELTRSNSKHSNFSSISNNLFFYHEFPGEQSLRSTIAFERADYTTLEAAKRLSSSSACLGVLTEQQRPQFVAAVHAADCTIHDVLLCSPLSAAPALCKQKCSIDSTLLHYNIAALSNHKAQRCCPLSAACPNCHCDTCLSCNCSHILCVPKTAAVCAQLLLVPHHHYHLQHQHIT
jgi:hypothetical protein